MKAIIALLGLLVITAAIVGCQSQEPAAPANPSPDTAAPATVEGTADLATASDDFAAMDEAVDSLE